MTFQTYRFTKTPMISVEEAKRLLIENIPKPHSIYIPLEKASQCILAEDVSSPMDVPSFDNSAMDGYAFDFGSYQQGMPFALTYIIQAGDTYLPVLKPGEAARIFTGAPLPEGTDTVVMQEKVEVKDNRIIIQDAALKKGSNVRLKASQTAVDDKVLMAGTALKPGIIGLLASMGLAEVKVFAAPRIGVIVTGKELIKPGNKLVFGQIYESNSYTLQAALSEMSLSPYLSTSVDDDETKILTTIAEYLRVCDLLLITGGISVGDYDFVQRALEKSGVEKIFYKVKQKPGKPLYCGRKDKTMVFGLPGNPAAVLTCFYEYVKPCIKSMKGMKNSFDNQISLRLSDDVTKREGLTHFMKGKIAKEEVIVLHSQESYKMDSFVESDCLIQLEEERHTYKRGEKVKVHPID